MTSLILTLIGPDRPGLVEALAAPVAEHGGNWLESRMAHLAGKFAGVLLVEVPDERAGALVEALGRLERVGLEVVVERSAPAPAPAGRPFVVDLVGLDRPGLVREISQVLAERGVNIEELTTDRAAAPMSGELLFRSRARVLVPPRTDANELRARLERLAGDLMVQVTLGEPEQH
ncbi:MAG TPA: ACT domain-containing protein [Anaeromyxobacteraceae bacterium]|nr:ACT domain-containing protein [Anaeromyxobacteraceae bacterium]